MALGTVTNRVRTGGGAPGGTAALDAKRVIIAGVAPKGTSNTRYSVSSTTAVRDALDTGGLAEFAAALLKHKAGVVDCLLIEPSSAGAKGAVTHTGTGAGTIAVSLAPHKLIEGEVTVGGALGTMAVRFRVGGGAWGEEITSVAGGPWTVRVAGTFTDLTFPDATYTGDEELSVGTDGTVTSSGSAATPATVTSAAGPFDFRGLGAPNIRVAFNAGGDQNFSITASAATRAGSGASYPVTATADITFAGGSTASVTITAAADAADMAGQINGQINGGSAVVNGTEVDLVSDRKGTGASATVANLSNSIGTSGLANGTTSGAGTVANDAAVTATELVSICSAITNGTATAVSGALRFTSTTTGASGTCQVKSASTADSVMGGEFATNILKSGAAAGAITDLSQESSPIDNYDLLVSVVKSGALGTTTFRPSLDDGRPTTPDMLVPASGVVVIPGTGIVLTASGDFVADDTYACPFAAPGYSTSDLDDALDALAADATAPQVALIVLSDLPSSAASAISAAEALDSALDSMATDNAKFYAGTLTAPYVGDTIVSGGVAIPDTADTDAVLKTARAGKTLDVVSVEVGTHRMVSPLSKAKLRRPFSWALAMRYVECDPAEDVSEVGRGPLDVSEIGRDESTATTSLHDAQFTVARSYPGENGVFIAIQAAGFGWRNMTTDDSYQDAQSVSKLLNPFLNAITIAGRKYLGSRQDTNSDGTIRESAARIIDSNLDGVARRATGLLKGGAYASPQASSASASVERTSQLGAAPRRLDVSYTLQPKGIVSDVQNTTQFSGVLPVTE